MYNYNSDRSDNMKRIILIPAYEPDDKLPTLVKGINRNDFTIIVVDDGSGENYKAIFNETSKYVDKVISYPQNQGKGYALKTGIQYIKDEYKKDYIIVTMDSDGQHTIKDATRLCDYIEKHPDELVTGKRPIQSNTPLRSRIGNTITRFVYHMATGIKLYDTQTGLRAFSDKLTDFHLEVKGNRFEYEMNIILFAPKLGIKIHEIEIETIYIENNSGSHFNTIKDSFRIYKEIFKFSLSSLISFVIDYILYTVLVITTYNITLSNIVARIVSATFNYNINRKVAFKSIKKVPITLIEYAILAIVILVINTIILNIFVNILFINEFLAKVITEILLFFFSWIIQKKIIFASR